MKRREFVKGIGVAGGLAALPWHGPAGRGRARAGAAWRGAVARRDGAREPQGLRGAARARGRGGAPDAVGRVERALAAGGDRRPSPAAAPARREHRPLLRGRSGAAVLGADAIADPQVPRRQSRRPLLLHATARRPPLPHPRQHRRRRLHLLHVPGRRDRRRRRHHRGAQPHAVRRGEGRQLRAGGRAERRGPQRRTARREDASRSRRATTSRTRPRRSSIRRCAFRSRSSPSMRLAPPPPIGDAESARRIRAAARFFRESTLDMPPRDPKSQPAWVSTVPNQLGKPGAGRRTTRPGTPWTTPTAWARTC